MFCQKCGEEIKASAKFCTGCSSPVSLRSEDKSSKMQFSGKVIIFIALIVILFVALVTNPSEIDHRSAVSHLLKQTAFDGVVESAAKSSNEWEMAGSALGLALGATFVDKIVESGVSRTNYLIFSTTEFNYQGKSRTIGFGIFGNVRISDQIKRGLLK